MNEKSPRRRRAEHRLLRHHAPLALASGAGLLAMAGYVGRSAEDARFIWSMSTAYVGLALLVATLVTGPINVLRKRRNPVSTDLRRDLGIWAGIVGIAHVVIGIQVHFRGRLWMYFVREVEGTRDLVLRTDLFGFANYTGLIATAILLLLLALSNDVSLRRLKAPRWKALQRWNYGLMAVAIAHGIAYQIIEKRQVGFVIAFGLVAALATGTQVAGYRVVRLAQRSPAWMRARGEPVPTRAEIDG